MSRRRALVVCPGRGSYDRSCLGTLRDRSAPARVVIEACDQARAALGRPTVSELDNDASFRTGRHVAGENASLLTFAASLADLAELDRDKFDVVAVAGNSMGFYTALCASGALDLASAIRLVETMGAMQQGNVIGGQVLYPITDERWEIDLRLRGAVNDAVRQAADEGFVVEPSIHLGGFEVLGADERGLKFLMAALPAVQRGERSFPVQLPLHSAFHTSLLAPTSALAQERLADLPMRPPEVPLSDGRGFLWRPSGASPSALWHYTLGHQVVRVYDFSAGLTAALHYAAPDVVIALGPGNTLGGPIARTLCATDWHGHRTKHAFEEANRADPFLLSFGVSLQRKALV